MKSKLAILLFLVVCNINGQIKSILWEAKKSDKVIYILGSYHLAPVDSLFYKEKIFSLIQQSDIIISEFLASNVTSDSVFLNRKPNHFSQIYKDEIQGIDSLFIGNKYIKYLTEKELFVKLQKKWTETSCILNYKDVHYTTLDGSIDEYCVSFNKKHYELENIIEQLNAIDNNYPDSDTLKIRGYNKSILEKIRKKIPKQDCNFDREYFNGVYNYDFSKRLNKNNLIITQRNKNWIKKILKQNENYSNIFLIVGILHLDYKEGLLELLKKEGYSISPIEL